MGDAFASRYAQVVGEVLPRARRTILCTIYEVQLEPATYAMLARVPLAVINDRIQRVGAALGADVLDLRTVCTVPADFVLQIEPSAEGALKIARAIARSLRLESTTPTARLFTG